MREKGRSRGELISAESAMPFFPPSFKTAAGVRE